MHFNNCKNKTHLQGLMLMSDWSIIGSETYFRLWLFVNMDYIIKLLFICLMFKKGKERKYNKKSNDCNIWGKHKNVSRIILTMLYEKLIRYSPNPLFSYRWLYTCLLFCRPTLACSVSPSTPTSACRSTACRLWRSTVARGRVRCRPICSPLLITPTLTWSRTGRTSPCWSREFIV